MLNCDQLGSVAFVGRPAKGIGFDFNLENSYKTRLKINLSTENIIESSRARGGFRGGGADAPSPSGIRPPADPKGPPFDIFSGNHFWPIDPKIFLKAPWAPIYTNFEEERAPKKNAIFLSKFFKKCPKTAFLTVFFKNLPAAQKFCQNRGKTVLWESSKNQFGRPKKKNKILENFLKIRAPPPPSRKS